jgi:hypothetical protein
MPTIKPKWSAIDTLFVLFASSTILLFLLWISSMLVGKENFNTLPGWVTGIADKWWTFVTSGAASTVLLWLTRKNKNTPNYFLGIGICTGSLIVLILLITNFVIPKPRDVRANSSSFLQDTSAIIRFKLDFKGAPQVLSFLAQKPKFCSPENLIIQNDGYFKVYADLPQLNTEFYALAKSQKLTSEFATDIDLTPLEMRFIRTKRELGPDKTIAIIRYTSEGKFELDKGDPGLIKLSMNEINEQDHSFHLFSSAIAQTAMQEKKYTGWIVPNISTLETEKKTGFTKVTLKSTALPAALKSANSYAYYISVNETPVCIDGFLPKYIRQPFSYKSGINLVFGLENLGFSGNADGYEKIKVRITFFQDDKPLQDITCAFDYVALRSTSATNKIITPDGSSFQWDALYKVPAGIEYEIFWVSPLQLEKARMGKDEIAKANMTYQNKNLVGVIRPPKPPNKHFGVCVGLVLPNRQIKFTFNKKDAIEFLSYVQKANKYAFLYRITGDQKILEN